MTFFKATFYALTAAALMTVPSAALANSANATNAFLAGVDNQRTDLQYLRLFDVEALPHRGERYLGSSRTATFFYKKGVKSFAKGNLEKADQHFRAVLRADASRGLNKATYHYLANIKHKQGFDEQSKTYAKAYYNIR